jgi:phosphoglycerate-specific signal transduction histidine kinase
MYFIIQFKGQKLLVKISERQYYFQSQKKSDFLKKNLHEFISRDKSSSQDSFIHSVKGHRMIMVEKFCEQIVHEMIQNSKTQSLKTFFSLSHELRQPVNASLSFL